MTYKQWASNEVLYATDLNALSDQTVIVATSSTKPGSPPTGMVAYETDLTRLKLYDGSNWVQLFDLDGWTNFNPTLTASSSNPTLGGGGTTTGRYTRHGTTVVGQGQVTFGTGPSAGSGTYRMATPLTTSAGQANMPCGTAILFDSSATAIAHVALVMNAGGTYFEMRYPATWPSGTSTAVTNSTPWTWANGDYLWIQFCYEMS